MFLYLMKISFSKIICHNYFNLNCILTTELYNIIIYED
ncbi:hypothetical protein, partial [Plasmodium yoelii yoelii]